MTHMEDNVELAKMLANARTSARLQTLELIASKLDRLSAENATREQILSTLKSWVSVRQSINTTESGKPQQ